MTRLPDRWLVALDRVLLHAFFRRIEVEGVERTPAEGPLIVVANHVNGLIDPMLVLGCLPRVVRFLGKSTLWDIKPLRPFLSWARVIPVYRRSDPGVDASRNRETFAASRRLMAQGGALAVFPEGKSHNEPYLAPLKTGAARIALEAEAEHGSPGRPLGVQILPVGLLFDARAKFRSRALVEVGEPFTAMAAAGVGVEELRSAAAADGSMPVEVVRALTDAIDSALQAVTVSFDTWEEARLVRRAAEIHGRSELEVPEREALAGSAARLRVFAEGYRELRRRHPEQVERTAEAVRLYDRLLETAGVRDRHVASSYPLPPVARFLRRSLGTLLVRLPLALVGTALNALPYQAVSQVGRRVKGLDQQATWKLFPAMLLYPLTWIAEAVLAGWLVARGWGGGTLEGIGCAGWLVALLVLVLGPVSGWQALLFHDRRSQLLYEARAFLKLRTRHRFAEELRAEREDIRRRVAELVELYRAQGGDPANPRPEAPGLDGAR